MSVHKPVYSEIKLPKTFYSKRKHILEAEPRRTNHDLLSFNLFNRLLDECDKNVITVVEFGVWRASFLENLAIHAGETGKELIIYGFDSFDDFPKLSNKKDLGIRSEKALHKALEANKPFTTEQVTDILTKYKSVKEINLVKGNICNLTPEPITADLIHYDMDYYDAFKPAMKWINNLDQATIAVDDYYQPTWTGMVDAVNEFGKEQGLYPINLSDYFRVERSNRSQWISLLKKCQ